MAVWWLYKCPPLPSQGPEGESVREIVGGFLRAFSRFLARGECGLVGFTPG